MTDLQAPAPSRGRARYYGFAFACLLVCGGLYLWLNSGPYGEGPAKPTNPAASGTVAP